MRKIELSNSTAAMLLIVVAYTAATLTTLIESDMTQRVLFTVSLIIVDVIIFMTLVYLASRLFNRVDVVDAAWGPAFIVAAIASFLFGYQGANSIGFNVQTLVTLLVIIWGARLSYTIIRRLVSHPEDKRYVQLRRQWKGNIALNTYGRVFFTQALLASVISIAVIHINISPTTDIAPIAYVGVIIWLIGFMFESVGDYQLKKFLADPKNNGRLMTSGLWKYTRHPNYFGEATQWWGIALIALATPYGWVGIITPLVITYLLLFVSGVPMTEKASEARPGWAKYKKQTSTFLPLPPKKV